MEMTIEEIKEAISQGKEVFWTNLAYQVIQSKDDYLIKCSLNGSCIGLTWADGVGMNGNPDEFFIKE